MTTAVIGATGHVGSEIVHGLLDRGDAVVALVRIATKRFGSSANPTGFASALRGWTTGAT